MQFGLLFKANQQHHHGNNRDDDDMLNTGQRHPEAVNKLLDERHPGDQQPQKGKINGQDDKNGCGKQQFIQVLSLHNHIVKVSLGLFIMLQEKVAAFNA